jgi:hypothetical protein
MGVALCHALARPDLYASHHVAVKIVRCRCKQARRNPVRSP